jgi:nitroreductase
MTLDERSPTQRGGLTDHPIHPLIAGRWSGRAIDPTRPVPRAVLLPLLEAARWAPSAWNNQPWRFMVLTGEDPDALETARGALLPAAAWARQAPVLILALSHKRYLRRLLPNPFHQYELGQSVAQMALQASVLGLVFHQLVSFRPRLLRRAFGIPRALRLLTLIAVGYPGALEALSPELQHAEQLPRRRAPLEALVHWNRWRGPSEESQ